jgi:hypothetical protein
MSLLEDVFKGGTLLTGVGVAIGAAVVAPAIVPVLRPLAKSMIKAGLMAYDQGRVVLAELSEQTSDIVAEVRSEMTHPAEAPGRASAVNEPQRSTTRRSRRG